jgi:uncharacterized protein
VSIQSQIQALESLAVLDEQLGQVEAELATERAQIGDKREHQRALESKLTAARTSVGEMERTRNELLTEARQMGLQLDRSREKLSRSRTEREVNAAQREIEELRKLFRDREIEVQRLGTVIEQARIDSGKTEEVLSSIAFEIGDQEGPSQNRLAALELQLSQLGAQREGFISAVPVVLYRRYELIRKKRGSGICHTTAGTCSACHISLSPMMFQTLRRTPKFDQCPSCSRILYYREPAAEPPSTAGDEGSRGPSSES